MPIGWSDIAVMGFFAAVGVGIYHYLKRRPTKSEAARHFPEGSRVQIVGHWGWPDGTKGTVKPFPIIIREMASEPPHSPDDFIYEGLLRRFTTQTGQHYEQWIELDVPTDDGSGDGPYTSTAIPPKFLCRLGD